MKEIALPTTNFAENAAIEDCFATGSVISECTYDGNSSSTTFSYAGGFVGRNNGTITRTYSIGNVSNNNECYKGGSSYTGGLAGYNYGTIGDSFATGNLKSTYAFRASSSSIVFYAGGLVGYTNNDLNRCYRYNGQSFELTYESELNDLGVVQTYDFITSFTFQAGLGFESEVWKMVNGQLPTLRMQ